MYLQLFTSKTVSGSKEQTSTSGNSATTTHDYGTEKTTTTGTEDTTSNTSTTGGGTSTTSGTSVTAYTGKVSDNTQSHYDAATQDYVQSQTVTDAYNKLNELTNNYSNSYESQLDDIYNTIVNRGSFNFDMNTDTFYNQMKDSYTAAGQSAMQDTLGQASALTGGYNSSYAQTAAQQSYQDYISQINDNLMDIYQMEADQYEQETQDLYSQYSMTKDMYDTDYNEYINDRDYYYNLYNDERDFDYTQYTNDRDYWTDEYWNEKMAEQTTTSSSTTNYSDWSNSNTTSHTDTTSDTTSKYSNKSKTKTSYNEDTTATASNYSNTVTGGSSGSSGSTKSSSSGSTKSSSSGTVTPAPLSQSSIDNIVSALGKQNTYADQVKYLKSLGLSDNQYQWFLNGLSTNKWS